jgi:hypothetical protein
MTGALILAGVLLFIVIRMQLGTQRVKAQTMLMPIGAAVVVGYCYLRNVPTNGSSMVLALAGAAVGMAAGLAAIAFMRVRRDSDGALYTVCGAGYLAVWVVVLAARIGFIYGSEHWFATSLDHFSAAHQLTEGSWTTFFVLQALAMILVRVVRVGLALLRSQASGQPASPGLTPADRMSRL